MKARRAQQPVAVASPLHDASLLRASLALPLQAADDNLPDFMFTLKLQNEADPPAVWHPCPLTAQNLPSGALSRTLSALAYGSLADPDVSAHLKHAFAGKAGLHNLQVDWVEHDGSPRCWLVSTCRQQPSSGNGTSIVLGVVREVTPARQLADDIAGGLLVTRETRARTRLIGASVAASMRQQAHLISSLCDLLAGTPQADANNAGHRYGELTSDVRGAVKELLACAVTLRDYTDAEYGSLKLAPQQWPAADILTHALPSMKQLLEQAHVKLVCDGNTQSTGSFCADLSRLSRLLHVITAAIVPALAPASCMNLDCTPAPGGGTRFVFSFEGTAPDLPFTAAPAAGWHRSDFGNAGLLHPAVSATFVQVIMKAHAGELFTYTGQDSQQNVALHLRDAASD